MDLFDRQTPDNRHYEALIDLLGQEGAIYGELSGLLDEESQAMLGLAIERLGEIAARKETLGLRIKALDESRKVLARRLGAQAGLTPDQVTVSQLSRLLPASVGGRLAAAGARLREIAVECQEKNAFNARAASRGLEMVNDAIGHLIERADPSGKVYQSGKQRTQGYATLSKTSGSGLISRRA
jgi:flagellar biosynthesis/type III secretory pathway chaperone